MLKTCRGNCSICRRTRFRAAVAREGGVCLLAGKTEPTPFMRPALPALVAATLWAAAATGVAAPVRATDACYVRAEAPAAEGAASAPVASYLGLRRKTEQLFEVDLAVAGPGDANCAVNGVARLRGERGAEVLGLVIRPDPARKSGRSGTLCQVFVQLTPAAVELRTTPSSCQAQALCDGRVELNGQRFEHASKLPAGAHGPCFDKHGP